MTESLLLYMNLRSKQIVRVFAGIGPFRCLFLSTPSMGVRYRV